MKKTAITAAIMTICATAAAQQLDTEVNLERTVKPVVRESQRLRGVVPTIVTTTVRKPSLTPAEYAGAGEISPEICPMPAARWADSVALTPYRGYVSAGYFPAMNLGVDLGYRLIDNGRANVGVWGQYTGAKYNADVPYSQDATFLNSFLTGGVDGTWQAGTDSHLNFAAAYTYGSVRRPLAAGTKYDQGSNQADIDVSWLSEAGRVRYHVDLGAGFFSFTDAMPDGYTSVADPLSQTLLRIGAGAGLCRPYETSPWLGLDLDYAMLGSNDLAYTGKHAKVNLGQGHLHPYIVLGAPVISLKVGANVSVATGEGGSHVKLAPDVRLDLTPSLPVSVYARLSGEEILNPVSGLYDANPYLYQYCGYGRSNVPFKIDGGVNFTPVAGLKICAEGGYASVKDWYLPVTTPLVTGIWKSEFAPFNFNCWHLGLNATLTIRSILVLTAEGAVGSADKGNASWCEWRDASRFRGGIKARFTPIDRLDLTVGYTHRGGRRVIDYTAAGEATLMKLDAAASLDAGATFRLTPSVTLFVQAENILNKHYLLMSRMPSIGLHGLAGAAMKF